VPADAPRRRRLLWLGLALLALNAIAAVGFAGLATTGGMACASLGLVAYLLGVRHAFDADHIAAIDNVTRRLRQHGQRPVAVGFFFSLGHSAVVAAMTLALVLATRHVQGMTPWMAQWGVPVSLLASALFLSLIGLLNVRALGKRGQTPFSSSSHFHLPLASGSRSMFPLGLLFGLNLDTAGEVLLLAGSAAALQGLALPPWLAMAFPLLFAAGMALADSLEGLLMLRLYDWAMADGDRSLRLNTATTALSAALALSVAGVQWLGLAQWAGAGLALPSLTLVDGAVVGAGATALMTVMWAAARMRRRSPAVARVTRVGVAS